MAKALEEVTKAAMDLPVHHRRALAALLLESADAANHLDAGPAWEAEIGDRIQAVDEGTVIGVAYEDVLRDAERRLSP